MAFATIGRQFGILMLAVSLAACGGGAGFGAGSTSGGGSSGGTSSGGSSSGGTSSGGSSSGGGSASVQSVSLSTSSPQLPSSASTVAQGVTLTALVRNQNNNVVAGVPVSFTAKRDAASSCGSGGALQVVNGTTDNTGTATATLFTGADQTNQTIDVSATAGGQSANLKIPETGTHITINGPTSVGLNSTASYAIKLTDAGNNPIVGQALTVTSAKGNGVTSSSMTTDSNGLVNVVYTASNSGADTLTAQPAGCSSSATAATQAIQVATQNLSIIAPNADAQIPFAAAGTFSVGATITAAGVGYATGDVLTVPGGTATTPAQLTVDSVDDSGKIVSFSVTNAGTYTALPSSPAAVTGGSGSGAQFNIAENVTVKLTGGTVSGQTITFNATRGVLASPGSATTGSGGQATVAITQPSAAGNAGGALIKATCTTCSPQISASVPVQFNATTPATVTLQASPSTVPIGGTSVITTAVRDADDNPVANQQVQFTLIDNSGGSLQQSSAITNSSGQATVTYQAGGTTSSANGVKITGHVAGATDGSTTLTVGGQALRIVLGTGNTITAFNTTQYQLPYSVLVTDAAGNPPPAGTKVYLTTNALAYQKGYEVFNTSANLWQPIYEVDCSSDGGCASTSAFGCFNEDKDLNGIIDQPPDVDYNNDGKLQPGNVTSVPPFVTLDANGSGQFEITYPKDRANWVQAYVTATVTVNGDQGTTTATFILPGLSSDFTNQQVSPPGQTSPYGDAPPPATTDVCANPPPN